MIDADPTSPSKTRLGTEREISPTLDTVLDLLSNRRRRYALYHLSRGDGSAAVSKLAETIADLESEPVDERRVRRDLYHSQLPRLAEAGVVEFDSTAKVVSLTAEKESPLTAYLELAAEEESGV